MSINIRRGLFTKEVILEQFIREEKPDIITIQETDERLSKINPFSLEGYKTITQKHKEGQKVRIITLVKYEGLINANLVKVKENLMEEDIPSIWLEIARKSKNNLTIGNIYREWGDKDNGENAFPKQKERIDVIFNQISEACKANNDVILCGDWNIDINRYKDDPEYYLKTVAEHFHDQMECNDLTHTDFGITRRGNENEEDSAIDYFLTRSTRRDEIILNENETKTPTFSTDHNAISTKVILETDNPEKNTKSTQKVYYKRTQTIKDEELKIKTEMILRELYLLDSDSANNKAKSFEVAKQTVLNLYCPFKKCTLKKGHKGFLSEEVKNLLKDKKKYRESIKELTGFERFCRVVKFKSMKNKLNKQILRETEEFYKNKILKSNMWKTIRSILDPNKDEELKIIKLIENGAEIEDETMIANIFATFFKGKVNKLQEKTINMNPDEEKEYYQKLKTRMEGEKCRFKFSEVDTSTVIKTIKTMKNSKASGTDGIAIEFYKKLPEVFAPYFVDIFNTSMRNGIYPETYKTGKVIPLYKGKGKKTESKNFRPITNIKTAAKIFDHIVNFQINTYMLSNKLFSSSQHGFRKSRSTGTALLTSLVNWNDNYLNKKTTAIAMLDMSAAFDLIDSNILCNKLKLLGFDNTSQNWFKSFLTDRNFVVSINGTESKMTNMDTGAPQGCPMSPTLFSIITVDLPLFVKDATDTSYADDITASTTDSETKIAIQKLEKETNTIMDYLAKTKMVPNPGKTEFMVIKPKRTHNNNKDNPDDETHEITISGTKIKASKHVKYLGIYVSNDLSWKKHVDYVKSNCMFKITEIRRLRNRISRKQLINFIHAHILSRIRYACGVYLTPTLTEGIGFKSDMTKLQTVINDAIRCVFKLNRKNSPSRKELSNMSGIPSLNHIVTEYRVTEVWKMLNLDPESIFSQNKKTANKFIKTRSVANNNIEFNFHINNSIPKTFLFFWNKAKLIDKLRSTNLTSVIKQTTKKSITELKIPEYCLFN